ncbi:uncharacterized protein [Drosophila pseudoobscura]|uniref:Uncharacterized protein n=1 Tax=Drosophila pseudoobscura pseudoobscura TaxID=46245 RepID=A0A6I8UDC8_DROPS|nr:uncharacterized protein LOC4812912 [Drosophila pseudoobscura]
MWPPGSRQGKRYGLGVVLPLAVGLLLCSAQTQSSVTSLRSTASAAAAVAAGDTLGDAAALRATAAQILEDARPSSVVQDWSLVCKELCGAGLGVTTPGEAHSTILRPEIDAAKCGQLCGLPRDNVGDRLCSSFCQQRHRSLSGCSPCQVQEVEEQKEWKEASAVQGNATHGPSSGESLAAVAGIAAASDGTTTATPDWNELCKALCKTGDGGSLCNCDLSPFFT